MIANAIRTGISAGFTVLGFLCVMTMVYCFVRALICFSGWVAAKAIGEEEDDEAMDD